MKKLLVEVSGVIDAPVEQVWNQLKPDLTKTWAEHPPPVSEVGDHSIAYQGGWWYRGEWWVTEHPNGSLVIHRVYNVAEWMRWGVPLANRFFIGLKENTRQGFLAGISSIAEKLGCSARLV